MAELFDSATLQNHWSLSGVFRYVVGYSMSFAVPVAPSNPFPELLAKSASNQAATLILGNWRLERKTCGPLMNPELI